jgi:hypothetical protein
MGQRDKDNGAGLIDISGAPLSSDIVTSGGVAYKNLKEIEPKALSDFVVCVCEMVDMETVGGIQLTRGDGQPFSVIYKVHSIGPELQMNKPNPVLFKGDRILPISPEVIEMPGSDKMWLILHESQIKAVIVEVKDAKGDGESTEGKSSEEGSQGR